MHWFGNKLFNNFLSHVHLPAQICWELLWQNCHCASKGGATVGVWLTCVGELHQELLSRNSNFILSNKQCWEKCLFYCGVALMSSCTNLWLFKLAANKCNFTYHTFCQMIVAFYQYGESLRKTPFYKLTISIKVGKTLNFGHILQGFPGILGKLKDTLYIDIHLECKPEQSSNILSQFIGYLYLYFVVTQQLRRILVRDAKFVLVVSCKMCCRYFINYCTYDRIIIIVSI